MPDRLSLKICPLCGKEYYKNYWACNECINKRTADELADIILDIHETEQKALF